MRATKPKRTRSAGTARVERGEGLAYAKRLMTLAYPIAHTAQEALYADCPQVGHAEAAARRAGGPVSLALEWVRPTAEEAEAAEEAVRNGLAAGYAQGYQDARGAPVIAVTYWRIEPVELELAGLEGTETPVEDPDAPTPILPVDPRLVRPTDDRRPLTAEEVEADPEHLVKRSKGRPRSQADVRQGDLFGSDD
jgi:hypothetical protein